MPYAPLLLLAAGLLLFLLSTKQFALWARAIIWALGTAFLASTIALIASDSQHGGLMRAGADLVEHWNDPSQSILVQALQRNAPTLDRYLLPLMDFFILIAGVLGVFALLAFTPGEGLEKVLRPLTIGLIGAIVGAGAALSIVGVGFGAVMAPRAYASVVRAADIQDGDTFWVGEVSVRLDDADAPELRQKCWRGGELVNCGDEARLFLVNLLDDQLVACRPRVDRNRRVDQSFGRPHVSCEVQVQRGRDIDVAQSLISAGYAVEYEAEGGRFRRQAATALRESRGLMGDCWLRPETHRKHSERASRAAFRAGDLGDLEGLVGAGCPNSDNPR